MTGFVTDGVNLAGLLKAHLKEDRTLRPQPYTDDNTSEHAITLIVSNMGGSMPDRSTYSPQSHIQWMHDGLMSVPNCQKIAQYHDLLSKKA
jgi:hypothetical protein